MMIISWILTVIFFFIAWYYRVEYKWEEFYHNELSSSYEKLYRESLAQERELKLQEEKLSAIEFVLREVEEE